MRASESQHPPLSHLTQFVDCVSFDVTTKHEAITDDWSGIRRSAPETARYIPACPRKPLPPPHSELTRADLTFGYDLPTRAAFSPFCIWKWT